MMTSFGERTAPVSVEYWSHPMVRDGKTVGAVITFFDITERKRRKRLRASEQRKRSLLELNNAIINNLTEEAFFASAYEAIRRVVPFDRAALSSSPAGNKNPETRVYGPRL